MMGIDLNTVEEDEEAEEVATNFSHHSWASSAATATLRRPSVVCLELWHACAGPVAPLPRKGSVVVYLPQGHLEHLGDAVAGGVSGVPSAAVASAVPPHVFCRVVDVTDKNDVFRRLKARPENKMCFDCSAKNLKDARVEVTRSSEGVPVLFLLKSRLRHLERRFSSPRLKNRATRVKSLVHWLRLRILKLNFLLRSASPKLPQRLSTRTINGSFSPRC